MNSREDSGAPAYDWNWRHFCALMAGNIALALGPWAVRLADSGPVAAGFWRMFLALPALALLARMNRQPLGGLTRRTWWAVAGAGVFFGLDLASWHIGIEQTRLGNATLFGNSGSIILMVWAMLTLRRGPTRGEAMAIVAALSGAAILLGRSLEIDVKTLTGDLLCVLAGAFYVVYILLLQRERASIGNWTLLFWSSLSSALLLVVVAVGLGEPVWPHRWGPLLVLAFGSQIFGQGLIVYALRHFPPLIIGVVLMTQPAVAILAGWYAFGETLTAWDALGTALVGAALVLARAGEKTVARTP